MSLESIEYRGEQDEVTLRGAVARPKGAGPHPVVLVSPTWAGCNDFIKQQAERLAELGYIGFAIDLYGDGRTSSEVAVNQERMGQLLADRQLLRRRLQAALDTARGLDGADSDRIAGIGYCFGGLCMLDLARMGSDMRGVVSFHGVLNNGGMPTSPIKASVLVLHGERDNFIPPEDITKLMAELDEAGADWQFHTYCRAVHGFTNPRDTKPEMGIDYDANADRRSWQSMQNFLSEIFAR